MCQLINKRSTSLNWHLLIRSWLFRITSPYQNIEHWSKDATQPNWCSTLFSLTALWWWTVWKTQLTRPMPACQWDCISLKGERWNTLGEPGRLFTNWTRLRSGWNVTEQRCLKMPGIGLNRLQTLFQMNPFKRRSNESYRSGMQHFPCMTVLTYKSAGMES